MELLSAIWSVLTELSPWLLLGAAVAGTIHVVLPQHFAARWLSGRAGVLRAVLLGVPLPLCSCGVIPAGLGLRKDGASKGAAIGFLTATPQTGVDSLLVSGAFLGWPFALFKVAAAFVLGMTGGLLVDLLPKSAAERSAPEGGAPKSAAPESSAPESSAPESPAPECSAGGSSCDVPNRASGRRGFREAYLHALSMVRMIWGWLVLGILLSAVLTTWAAAVDLGALVGGGGILPLFATLLVAVPLYVCATASVPIAAALVAGGFPPGAALVFLMAGPATNVATLGAVRGAFGLRATIVYLSNIVVGSLVLGWGFDFLLSGGDAFAPSASHLTAAGHNHGASVSFWQGVVEAPVASTSAFILLGLVAWFAWTELAGWARLRLVSPEAMSAAIEIDVDGMMCGGCVSRLKAKLEALDGVDAVEVILEPRGHVSVVGDASQEMLRATISEAGYKPV